MIARTQPSCPTSIAVELARAALPAMDSLLADLGMPEADASLAITEEHGEHAAGEDGGDGAQAGGGGVRKRPAQAGGLPKPEVVVAKKPAGAGVAKKPAKASEADENDENHDADAGGDESEPEAQAGDVRDRIKAKKFDKIFDELPEVVQQAWQEAICSGIWYLIQRSKHLLNTCFKLDGPMVPYCPHQDEP